MSPLRAPRVVSVFASVFAAAGLGAASVALAICGPFLDTAADSFCPFVQEIFYLGITTGTTPTTFSPGDNATRLQMAAFLSRSVDRILQRGSRRAVLDRTWTPAGPSSLGITTLSGGSLSCACDGADVWVVNTLGSSVSRVRASDGRLLETWTGATLAYHAVVASQGIFIDSQEQPGPPKLYRIVPSQPAGSVTTVVTDIGDMYSRGIAFDGARIWTANAASVSIVTPGPTLPWTVTVRTSGFNQPEGVLYDGTDVWVTDFGAGTLLRLDASGSILQTVTVGTHPEFPIFDGSNIWVPVSGSDSLAVVRASSGAVLATLTGNGLFDPISVAFDGQRVLAANLLGDSVSLWKAADLTPLGSVSTGSSTIPRHACSDGANFWVVFFQTNSLGRF